MSVLMDTGKNSHRDHPLPPDSPFHPLDAARVILETEAAVAFYDGFPLSEGHALVVPRTVAASLYELDADVQAAVWDAVRMTRELLD